MEKNEMQNEDLYCARQAHHCATRVLEYLQFSSIDENFVFLQNPVSQRPGHTETIQRENELKKLREQFATQKERLASALSLIESAGFRGTFTTTCLAHLKNLREILAKGETLTSLLDIQRCLAQAKYLSQEIQDGAGAVMTGRTLDGTSQLTEIVSNDVVMRLLLLADLHCGMREGKWLWPNDEDLFLNDLEMMLKDRPIDLVVFAGDMVFSGEREQFDEFDRILGVVWNRLKKYQTNPLLLTAPGNHDLLRPRVEDRHLVECFEAITNRHTLLSQILDNRETDSHRLIQRLFTEYQRWQRVNLDYQRREGKNLVLEMYNEGPLPGDFSCSFSKHSRRLGIAGLNTAFRQLLQENYAGRLLVDGRQLQGACKGHCPNWARAHDACLLITHHPVSWLDTEARQQFDNEIYLAKHFCIHIHGHMHEPNFFQESQHGARPKPHRQLPSLFGPEKYFDKTGHKSENRMHGYCLLEVHYRDRAPVFRYRYRIKAPHGGGLTDGGAYDQSIQPDGWSKYLPAGMQEDRSATAR